MTKFISEWLQIFAWLVGAVSVYLCVVDVGFLQGHSGWAEPILFFIVPAFVLLSVLLVAVPSYIFYRKGGKKRDLRSFQISAASVLVLAVITMVIFCFKGPAYGG